MVEIFTVSMDRTLKDLLDNYCERHRCGRSEIIRRALIQHISSDKLEVTTSEKTEQPRKTETPKPPEKTSKPLDVAEKVKKIIERKPA